jgi:hypothetical protein
MFRVDGRRYGSNPFRSGQLRCCPSYDQNPDQTWVQEVLCEIAWFRCD